MKKTVILTLRVLLMVYCYLCSFALLVAEAKAHEYTLEGRIYVLFLLGVALPAVVFNIIEMQLLKKEGKRSHLFDVIELILDIVPIVISFHYYNGCFDINWPLLCTWLAIFSVRIGTILFSIRGRFSD
ncbi:MAG: hypothetical protein IJC46_00865 [Clostridia bacterium]|nr:hypothetical protein [Clostridia bacterium]